MTRWYTKTSRRKNVMESLIARLIELPPQTPNTLSPETYIAGSRGLRHNHLQAKLLGLFHHGSDLLRAVPGFVVFGAFVDVLLAAFDEPVVQASQFASHRGNGFGCSQPSTQPSVLRTQIALAAQQSHGRLAQGRGCPIDDLARFSI